MSEVKTTPEKVDENQTQTIPDFEPSAELVERLGRLTKQQRTTMLRVVEAHLSSVRGSISRLFEGEDKVCAASVWKGQGGWHNQPKYRAALDLYLREYQPHYLKTARKRAADIIEAGAVAAAARVMDLIDSDDEGVAYRAAKDALDRLGIGTEIEHGERVTVIINDAEWRPN